MTDLASPPASRVARPRWRDTRLLLGVLLVLVSVTVGARVVAGADSTSAWLRTVGDLPAGHVLTDADLVAARAHLDAAASGRYFRDGSRAALVGRPLIRAVGAGNFLPRDALAYGSTTPSRVVPVVVKAGRLPALRPGDLVDLYVLVRGDRPVGDAERRVLTGVEFLAADTLGSGDTSVQLRVAVADAPAAVAASQSERADLVRVDTGGATAPQPAGPVEAPGFGS